MLHILLFCVGIMYTPGPVNLLSLNNGLQRGLTAQLPFCLGVGVAMSVSMMLAGYAGSGLADTAFLPYVALAGCVFILYLAFKVLTSSVNLEPNAADEGVRGFRDGLLMQILNPKSFLVVLPVGTVQFPAEGIHGPAIALWSVGLGMLAFGAPTSWAAAGALIGRRIANPKWFRLFNLAMGLLLVFVALDMAWEQTILPLWG